MVGTPYYMASEVLLEKYYNEKVDVLSAGVTAYLMLSGGVPFRGKTSLKIFEAVKFEHLRFRSDQWRSISDSAKDLIRLMLSRDVTKRLSAQQALCYNCSRQFFVPTKSFGKPQVPRLFAICCQLEAASNPEPLAVRALHYVVSH